MPRKPRKGNIRYRGYGSRKRDSEVTTHPIRIRQFPKRSLTARNKRFTIPTPKFSYLPHATRYLGPAHALGDDIIVLMDFKVTSQITQVLDSYFGNKPKVMKGRRKKTTSNVQKLRNDLRAIARGYFKRIRDEARLKIREVVPKMTGRLRNGMVASLTRSINTLRNIPYILKLNTLDPFGNPIYYANPVNNMPTRWLAHPPNEPLKRTHNGKVYHLYDPLAESDWYNKVLKYARDYAFKTRKTIRLDLIKLYGITPLTDLIYQTVLKSLKFK